MTRSEEDGSTGLGKAVQVLRTSHGYSRKELAERAGISYPYLSEIESGKKEPSGRALASLARALGMRQHQLMELADRYAEGADPVEMAESVMPMAASGMPERESSWFGRDLQMRHEMLSPASALHSPREEVHRLVDQLDESDLEMVRELLRRLSSR